MMNVAVVIPAFNEETTIAKVVAQARQHADAVFVCDDGSTDSTLLIAASLRCELLRHTQNLGKGAAIRTLFQDVLRFQPRVVVTLDADGQHDPSEIETVCSPILTGEADVVIGSRSMSGVRGAGNRMLSNRSHVSDSQSGFRAYRGSELHDLIPSEMGMGVDSEILDLAARKGLRIMEVPIKSLGSPNPHKTNIVFHFLDVAAIDFKLFAFRHPLVLFGIPGFLLCLAALYFGLGALPQLEKEGFGSVVLAIAGLFFISTAVIIWSMSSLLRRATA